MGSLSLRPHGEHPEGGAPESLVRSGTSGIKALGDPRCPDWRPSHYEISPLRAQGTRANTGFDQAKLYRPLITS